MSASRVKIVGIDDLNQKFKALGKVASGRQLGQAALAGAMQIETYVKLSMGEIKSGRMYGEHQASAPGEPPAIDTGALVNSIISELQETTATSATAAAGTNMDYGAALEYGTPRVAARPFMRPAIDDHEAQIVNTVRTVLETLVMEAVNG